MIGADPQEDPDADLVADIRRLHGKNAALMTIVKALITCMPDPDLARATARAHIEEALSLNLSQEHLFAETYDEIEKTAKVMLEPGYYI